MKKIKLILILFLLFSFVKVNAATTATLRTSSNDVNVGDEFNVSVSVNDAAAWNLHLAMTGPVGECSGYSGPDDEFPASLVGDSLTARNTSKTFTTTCKATGEGTITFTLTGDITNESEVNVNISSSAVVNVTRRISSNQFNLSYAKYNNYILYAGIPVSGAMPVINMPFHCKDATCSNFVYCYERAKDAAEVVYGLVDDSSPSLKKGLVYLVNRMNGEKYVSTGGSYANDWEKYADHWVKQVVIWLYLGSISNEELEYLKSNSNITLRITNNQNDTVNVSIGNIYNTIKGLIEDAKNFEELYLPKYTESTTPLDVKMVEKDKSYYETSAIPLDSFGKFFLRGYSISLSGIEGAYAVDENGTTITGITNASKFYIRVPSDKFKKSEQLKVTVSGYFNGALDLYKAVNNSDTLQPVIDLSNRDVIYSREFTIVGVPDTALSVTSIVYIVGFIALLFGGAIIYRNVNFIKER